ncbi:MAG: acetyltransferase [Massilia sp.]|nr:acetyltransferase [Massilia sp.]
MDVNGNHDDSGNLPPWDVFIISAGGFGRTMLSTALGDPDCNRLWRPAGFLDGRTALAATAPLPVLGDPLTYQVAPYRAPPDPMFVCALGEPAMRRKYAAPLLAQGARFMNLCTGLRGAANIRMGQGCIFDREVQMGADTRLGDFVLVQSTAVIGYEVEIGSYASIHSFAFIGGGARIGEDVIVYPHATILPGITVGRGAVIGAGSVIMADVPPGVTMIGNPAKIFRFK